MEDAARSLAISTTNITLTEDLPVLRLAQLCTQGKYKHRMIWDRFDNGYMITCEVYGRRPAVGNKRRTLTKEVRWVETQDLRTAQNTIAAILLDRAGLGVSEDECDDEDEGEETSPTANIAGMMEHLLHPPTGTNPIAEVMTPAAMTNLMGIITGIVGGQTDPQNESIKDDDLC